MSYNSPKTHESYEGELSEIPLVGQLKEEVNYVKYHSTVHTLINLDLLASVNDDHQISVQTRSTYTKVTTLEKFSYFSFKYFSRVFLDSIPKAFEPIHDVIICPKRYRFTHVMIINTSKQPQANTNGTEYLESILIDY